jgi:hypothetical protein
MDGNEGFSFGIVSGVLASILFLVFSWHVGEANCQEENNVYDCEWVQSPFLPVAQDLE